MSTRNLDAIFRPKSIALIGASTGPKSVGFVTARNLLGAGFGEMAFVLETAASMEHQIVAIVRRLSADPDNRRAEFAATVRSDLKGRGIGRLLMQHLIEYGRQRGIGEFFGDVLKENVLMVALCRELRIAVARSSESLSILRASLRLEKLAASPRGDES